MAVRSLWLGVLSIVACLAAVITTTRADEQRAGLALVVGISDYQQLPDLKVAAADAS